MATPTDRVVVERTYNLMPRQDKHTPKDLQKAVCDIVGGGALRCILWPGHGGCQSHCRMRLYVNERLQDDDEDTTPKNFQGPVVATEVDRLTGEDVAIVAWWEDSAELSKSLEARPGCWFWVPC